MSRFVRWLGVLLLLMPVWAVAEPQDRPLSRAMDLMRDGNWAAALIEARGDGQPAVDVILWHYLRAGLGDARQVQDFLRRNPDWPGLPYLRKKSEIAINAASAEEVIAFFQEEAPQTGAGALALARALRDTGKADLAIADIVLAWRTLRMSEDEQDEFIATYGDQLRPHHAARMDLALWNGWLTDANGLMPLMDASWKALAEARMALRADEPGVDALIEKVPPALRESPGLAYERFFWRLRKGRTDDAVKLLLERSVSAEMLGEPWAWARHRADLARNAMRAMDYERAYEIASRHFLVEGRTFSELEWLSGYLALRFLDKPDLALAHFRRFGEAVDTPISLGRAGYWTGRAEEALGDAPAARKSYLLGARYQTSFYGQLAAEKAGLPFNLSRNGPGGTGDWRDAPFTKSSVYKAAVLLLASDELVLANRFFTHLAESLDRTQIEQMGLMLEELKQPHILVMLGKRAARFGMEVPRPYYALHPLAGTQYPVPTELVLAIARRESEFNPDVTSPAGALGLMQLMPRTAKEVSGWLGEEYSLDRLVSDTPYNVTLGATYLADLAERFDGNAVLIAAAYNAGPSRVQGWLRDFGDPRDGKTDVIDWIEHIPFDETRNYIMRVTESLPIYRAWLGLSPHPVPFSQELAGSTIHTRAPERE